MQITSQILYFLMRQNYKKLQLLSSFYSNENEA